MRCGARKDSCNRTRTLVPWELRDFAARVPMKLLRFELGNGVLASSDVTLGSARKVRSLVAASEALKGRMLPLHHFSVEGLDTGVSNTCTAMGAKRLDACMQKAIVCVANESRAPCPKCL